MGFRLKPIPYDLSGPSVFKEDLGSGVLGVTNKQGTIAINKNLKEEHIDEVVCHEKVHEEQIRRGDLSYDGDNIYWKGRKYNQKAHMVREAKNTPWEKEAYIKSNTKHGQSKYGI